MNTHGRHRFTRSRSWARRLAMQALYQWQLTEHSPEQIGAQFCAEQQDIGKADSAYFQELLYRSVAALPEIQQCLTPHLDRPWEQIDPVEKAILWIGGYELLHRLDIPYRVVINESVELAKKFGAEQGHRFINGVLDKAAHDVRTAEIEIH